MFKDLTQAAISLAIVGIGGAIIYFFYTKSQANAATAQSIALNNQAFQQQIQTQELQSLTGTLNGNSVATSSGILATNTGETPS